MSFSRPGIENSTSFGGFSGSVANRRVLLCFTQFLADLTVYNVTRSRPFINYDDDLYVTDKAHVRAGLSRQTIKRAFTSMDKANWHRVALTSRANGRGTHPNKVAISEMPTHGPVSGAKV